MGRRRRLHGRNGHHLRPALSATADLIVRYADPNNFYAIRIQYLYQGLGDRTISLLKRVRGKETTLATNTYTQDTTLNLKVEVDGSTIKAWLDDVEKINTNGLSEIPAGGVGLRTAPCSSFVYYVWFDNLKVGYDNNSDGDIDDEGDDLITSNGFGSTALSLTHDNNGNLTDDGMYKYTYDPWNRLVKVTAKEDTDI
ncbi:MAG: hypothetical protein KAV00_18605, partial [Phycisphaerae bacterium]|nr:hypothetical protein [Phycisphaerae bacterium]